MKRFSTERNWPGAQACSEAVKRRPLTDADLGERQISAASAVDLSRTVPFFSVIVPTFNRALLLRSALESILLQGCTDYEVIVVDDGSTDDTAAIVRPIKLRETEVCKT